MKASKTLVVLSLITLPISAAVASDYGKDKAGAAPTFSKLDTNRDGKISQAEASADTTIVFSSADANGDGYLDKSEWTHRDKGSPSPAPQSDPTTTVDPTLPQSGERAPADTETPRQ